MPNKQRQAARKKHPVPLIAQAQGFFHRLRHTENPSSLRLLARNQDPYHLELFITATTQRWRCFVDPESPLHCYQCSQRQQRECTMWALARAQRYWSQLLRAKRGVSFLEHPLVRKSRECLVVIWLRLQRIYRIDRRLIEREAFGSVHEPNGHQHS